MCVQESAKAAEALLLDKEAFLPSHKFLMDKARVLHNNGIETTISLFNYFFGQLLKFWSVPVLRINVTKIYSYIKQLEYIGYSPSVMALKDINENQRLLCRY